MTRLLIGFLLVILPFGRCFLSLPQRQNHRLPVTSLGETKVEAEGSSSRRDVLQVGAIALASLLVPGTSPSAEASEPKTIVLTGGNSGEQTIGTRNISNLYAGDLTRPNISQVLATRR